MFQKTIEAIQTSLQERIGLNPKTLPENGWQCLIRQQMKQSQIENIHEYYVKLCQCKETFQAMIEAVVVPETWFFREVRSFEFLIEILKSDSSIGRPIKVLSVPCSTGEEAYSIAITLFINGLDPSEFVVDAYDVSQRAIQVARRGVYERRSFRGGFSVAQGDFFIREGDQWVLKDRVKNSVFFNVGNVLEPTFAETTKPYHVIFFRNLLMYLNADMQIVVLKQLKQLLIPQGSIIVGESECYPRLESQAHLEVGQYSFVYKEASEKKEDVEKMVEVNDGTETLELDCSKLKFARKLADSGRFLEAERIAHVYLDENGINPEAYFLLGLVQHALGNEKKAEEFFEKSIYLDPRHHEALVYLSLLAEKRSDFKKAELFKRRAYRSGVN